MTSAHAGSQHLVELALGELDAAQAELALEHVESCAECSRELDFLAEVVSVAARPRRAVAGARRRTWTTVLAAAAAVALIVFVADRGLDRAPRWSDLADRSVPLYVAAELRAPAPTAASELDAAMAGWDAGEFARVDAALDAVVAAHADHAPARFWRGVARRELGRLDDAAADLRAAADLSSGYLREHALWVLAGVQLVRERPEEALATLTELESLAGDFAAQARELRARVESRR